MPVTFHCEGCVATATTDCSRGVHHVDLPPGWEWRPAPGQPTARRLYCGTCIELQDSAARVLAAWLRRTNWSGLRGQA